MWKLQFIAALVFLIGLVIVITGMLGFVSVKTMQIGSGIIFLSLALRVISLFKK